MKASTTANQPEIQIGQTFVLKDKTELMLGQFTVEKIEEGVVYGHFAPTTEFSKVEPLFTKFVECANEMLLHHVGLLDDKILAMGLHLGPTNGIPLPDIYDVQIFERSINFRLKENK